MDVKKIKGVLFNVYIYISFFNNKLDTNNHNIITKMNK